MDKSNVEQVLVARAHLKSELESLCKEIIGENQVEGVHFFGLYHVITYSQLARLEQLVALHVNKAKELSAPLFSTDPEIIIAAIGTAIPAYEDGGKVQLGYAVRSSIVSALRDEVVYKEAKREVDSSLPAAADPAVKAEFEQWYREEISTEPADLEQWNNSLYIHTSTHQYFAGFVGGIGRRKAAAEAVNADEAQNVQPRLDTLIDLVSEQLAKSRAALGQS